VQLAAAWSLTVPTELFNFAVGLEYLTMDNSEIDPLGIQGICG
jgi:hypothetical protein